MNSDKWSWEELLERLDEQHGLMVGHQEGKPECWFYVHRNYVGKVAKVKFMFPF